MNEMIDMMLRSAACSLLLYSAYILLAKRETFHRFSRFFLVSVPLLSLLIPLISLPVKEVDGLAGFRLSLIPVDVGQGVQAPPAEGRFPGFNGLILLYLAGAMLMLARLLYQVWRIVSLMARNRSAGGRMKIVAVDSQAAPFSFFNYIFIPETMLGAGGERTILAHEQVHVRQRHSVDLLLMEGWAVVQWFNPVSWLMRREMKLIHEYLADAEVLRSGISLTTYQKLILDESMGVRTGSLTNHFNVSNLKKRMIMMTKERSGWWAKSRILLALPAIAVLMLFFTAPVKNVMSQDKQGKAQEQVDQWPEFTGGQEALIKYMVENIKYPDSAVKKNIQGTVYIAFMVHANGSVSDVKVQKGIGYGCDEEAVRVIRKMPSWVPGKAKGKAVDVAMTMPVKFKLDGDEHKKSK